jgi:Ca2+-binding EF-hand superfamily protein
MKSYKTLLLATATVGMIASAAFAETVNTKTVVQQQDIPGVNKINFMAFDLNGDGILSMREIGERLFELYDTDGNGSIDNIEVGRKAVMTIIPMEKMSATVVDIDDDGVADHKDMTYEKFIQQSHLARFDENKDGLTAAEFIGKGYEVLDDDQDKLISLEEWKEAYKESLHIPVNEPERYKQ